ncbi:MAG: hypothetical protein P9L97_05945 [Candidatus Tenebribacter davisii]|nr:hypothetical protein [Candidatus Tenebribacter davisii]
MALNAILGDAFANSYVTAAEAEVYFEDRMHSSAWDTVDDGDPLLISASQMLDWYVKWKGDKATAAQARQWPRTDVTRPDGTEIDEDALPPEVKIAVYELAFMNIGADRTAEDPLAGIGQLKAGSLMIKAGAEKPNQTNPKVIPSHVYQIISDLYIKSGGTVWLDRA